MASAVTGFLTTFGVDEPMGCYDDIDHADVFVLWGNNMAEMHPVLFSRMLDRRLHEAARQIIDLATRRTRTSMAADRSLCSGRRPTSAIANAICHEIPRTAGITRPSSNGTATSSKADQYRLRPQRQGIRSTTSRKKITFEDYRKLLDDYTPEKAEQISGVPAEEIRYLASLYGDPKRKVMSLWCMGFNQHTAAPGSTISSTASTCWWERSRRPGNSPFSLTGQPSACGTVREVGTLTNRLPHGEVKNESDRKLAAEIWGVPLERIPDKPTYHTVAMFRALDRGDIRFLWIQVTNPMVTMPKLKRYRDGGQEGRPVRRGLRRVPDTDDRSGRRGAAVGDVDRAGGDVREFGAADAALRADAAAPGRGHERRLADDRGGAADGLREAVPLERDTYIQEIWREYSRFHAGPEHALASYEELRRRPGVMWPYVKGKETKWRYNAKYDPGGKEWRCSSTFTASPIDRAWIWFRPYEPPPEVAGRASIPSGSTPAASSSTGTAAR